jgi:hypothetical protein
MNLIKSTAWIITHRADFANFGFDSWYDALFSSPGFPVSGLNRFDTGQWR